jgi:hypothetical protein
VRIRRRNMTARQRMYRRGNAVAESAYLGRRFYGRVVEKLGIAKPRGVQGRNLAKTRVVRRE